MVSKNKHQEEEQSDDKKTPAAFLFWKLMAKTAKTKKKETDKNTNQP